MFDNMKSKDREKISKLINKNRKKGGKKLIYINMLNR